MLIQEGAILLFAIGEKRGQGKGLTLAQVAQLTEGEGDNLYQGSDTRGSRA